MNWVWVILVYLAVGHIIGFGINTFGRIQGVDEEARVVSTFVCSILWPITLPLFMFIGLPFIAMAKLWARMDETSKKIARKRAK